MNHKSMRALLLVEDSPADARLFREMFNEQGPHNTKMTHVLSMGEAEQQLARGAFDIIMLDLCLPDAEGLGAVRRAHAAAPGVPLVVLTGSDDETLAGLALHEGAQDYLIKGEIETRGLLRALRHAIERKGMEQAEKARAEATLNSISDAVVCTDAAGNITFLNLVAEQMSGWGGQEAAGRPVAEVFRIRDGTTRSADRLEVAAAPTRPAPLRPRGVLTRRDGLETPVEDAVVPMHDDDGKATGSVVVLRDVSARKRIEQERETTQRLLASVFGVIDQALGVADHAGNFMMVNAALTRQLGWSVFDLVGKPFTRVIGEASRKWLLRQLAVREEQDETCRLPTELLHRDGTVTAGEIVSAVIPQPDGRLYRVVTYLLKPPAASEQGDLPVSAAIREVLQRSGSPATIVAGKVQLVGLAEIREKLGDRWPEVSAGVFTMAEHILRRHLGPKDSCNRTADDGFMVCFAELGETAAQEKAQTIAGEIRATLTGLAPEMASARVEGFAAKISIENSESGSDEAIIQAVEGRLTRERMRMETGATEVLHSGLTRAQILFQRVRTDTNQQAPYTMARLPKPLELSLGTLRALGRQDYGLESELLLLTGASERLLGEISANRTDVILVPVRMSTLLRRRDAERWLQIARSMAELGKRRMIVEITELYRDTARSRMTDLVMMISSVCRAVAYELPVAEPGFVNGLPTTVALATIMVERLGNEDGGGYLTVATKLTKVLHNRNCRLLVKNIASANQAMSLARAGVPLLLTEQDPSAQPAA